MMPMGMYQPQYPYSYMGMPTPYGMTPTPIMFMAPIGQYAIPYTFPSPMTSPASRSIHSSSPEALWPVFGNIDFEKKTPKKSSFTLEK